MHASSNEDMIEKKLENSLYLIGHQPKFHENAEYSFVFVKAYAMVGV